MSRVLSLPVKIQTLGGLSLQIGDKEVISPGKNRVSSLLKVILSLGGRGVSEMAISDILWPDADGDNGLHNLKVTLHRLRKLIGKQTVLLKDGYVSLNPEIVHVDVWEFEKSLHELEKPDKHPGMDIVQSVIAQYKDGFLQNDMLACVVTTHEKLRSRFLRVVGNVAERLTEQKEWNVALECYQKLSEIDPLVESAYLGMACCYQQLGLISEGLSTYERCQGILARELGIKPSLQMEMCRRNLLNLQSLRAVPPQKKSRNEISKSDALFMLELINESLSVTTDGKVNELMSRLNEILPYQATIACSVKFRDAGEVEALNVLNVDYPVDYLDELARQNLISKDLVLQENFKNYQMQYWEDTLEKTEMTGDMLKILSLAEDFGFSNAREGRGYAHGVRDYSGKEGSFFCYHGLERSRRTEKILSYVIPHLHVALNRSVEVAREDSDLTHKELEVVKWLKRGVTTWDISILLGLSENDVHGCIKSILRKLGASTTSHAVALAMKHGYLSMD